MATTGVQSRRARDQPARQEATAPRRPETKTRGDQTKGTEGSATQPVGSPFKTALRNRMIVSDRITHRATITLLRWYSDLEGFTTQITAPKTIWVQDHVARRVVSPHRSKALLDIRFRDETGRRRWCFLDFRSRELSESRNLRSDQLIKQSRKNYKSGPFVRILLSVINCGASQYRCGEPTRTRSRRVLSQTTSNPHRGCSPTAKCCVAQDVTGNGVTSSAGPVSCVPQCPDSDSNPESMTTTRQFEAKASAGNECNGSPVSEHPANRVTHPGEGVETKRINADDRGVQQQQYDAYHCPTCNWFAIFDSRAPVQCGECGTDLEIVPLTADVLGFADDAEADDDECDAEGECQCECDTTGGDADEC